MTPSKCALLPMMALALLVGCGGGGDSSDDSSNTAAPATPASTASTPSTPSTPSSGPDVTCGIANFEAEALRIVNQYRAAGATCGARGSFASAGALTLEPLLTASAYGHSRDMADRNYFSHDSLDGRSMVDRINATGYDWSTVGENIAAGYDSVQSTVAGWMGSDGHCANLMNPRFTEFGLACARNDNSAYRIYWTQNLGAP